MVQVQVNELRGRIRSVGFSLAMSTIMHHGTQDRQSHPGLISSTFASDSMFLGLTCAQTNGVCQTAQEFGTH